MTDPKIETFEQFWDYYVGEHKKKATRLVHFVGTTAAIGCVAGGLLTKRRWLLLLAPVVGYGPAWASHFFIEKNKPLTFEYPLWSLRADFVMWWKTLSGQMQAEVDRVLRQEEEARESGFDDAGAPSSIQSGIVN
ncbi:MAG TPA: DUF962 domain-containing protein, partial [Labilithrix sp.]|nr:DUF962 domain-containing protein [Labilithrix sp.]